ncbi:MAG TPA: acetate/propionate family kinase [Gemmatimonadaceae bacterium]|nr:acetate/propionate family kinase [Gemmatimonadaceae bacterium]
MALGRRLILVFNVGSSTLKYALFAAHGDPGDIARGSVEYSSTADSASAADKVLDDLTSKSQLAEIVAVGHRLVHGGIHLCEPVVIDPSVRQELRALISLAPDHLPLELQAVDAVSKRLPHAVQVACFDTAFHSQMPRHARLFGIPRKLSDAGVLRYGFHGLSYEYIVATLRDSGRLPRRAVVAHMGNGASITAILDGVSIDTSMGMTPTGGMVMSTRSGDLDPGAVLFMMRALGFSVSDLENAVDKEGGLLGISEYSSDVRTLLSARATMPKAADAIDAFCYQARKFIGAYAAALGGLDLIVFTGGVGEHSAEIRSQICSGLEFVGVEIEDSRNRQNAETISPDRSRVRVAVMTTNEEKMIARHVQRVTAQASTAR